MDAQNSCEVNREHSRIPSGVFERDSTKQNGLVTLLLLSSTRCLNQFSCFVVQQEASKLASYAAKTDFSWTGRLDAMIKTVDYRAIRVRTPPGF